MSFLAIALMSTLPATTVLTLEEAERTALASQPTLRSVEAQVEMAEARTEGARSPLLPQLSFNASYTRSTSNSSSRRATIVAGQVAQSQGHSFTSYDFFNFGLTATQLIYDFGQASRRYDAMTASFEAQVENERATRQTVLRDVRLAFLDALAQRELVRVAEETLANQQRRHAEVEAFVEVRLRPEIDLAQAKLELENARVQLINAETGFATAKARLNHAMGLEASTDYELAEVQIPVVRGEDGEIEQLLHEALARRGEVASARKQIEAQRMSISAAEGGYAPTLSASLSTTASGPAVDNLAPNWSAGLNLSWPIFSGFATSAAVREAKASLTVTEAQADALRQQIRLEIQQAQLRLRSAKASLGAAEEALAAAEKRLELAEARYASGVGSILELGDAQVARTSAAAQLVQAEYALASARVALRQALGLP